MPVLHIEAGKGDEGEVRGREHQFEAHEDDDEVAPQQHSGESDRKESGAHEHDHDHDHDHESQHEADIAEHQHNDISAHYQYHCATPAQLKSIDLAGLFKLFTQTEKIQVQLIAGDHQQGAELSAKNTSLSW